MTTNITELAQRNELLIANGQQTADLLRHLADNEIDSDYFAVVSECESYGKETDAELSITEFALRAAGYVDALVEALEKAQQQTTESENRVRKQNRHICELFDDNTALRQRIAGLEARAVKLPKLKMLEDYLAEVAIEERKQILVGVKLEFHRACVNAGIKVEAE